MRIPKLRALILSMLIAVVLYLLAAIASDLEAIGSILSRLGVWELSLIFGLSLLNYALRFIRWHWYTRALGHAVPMTANLVYYLAGFAFTVTPGKTGEAVRSIYLKPHGMSYPESLAAFFTERLLDLMAMIFLSVLVMSQVQGYGWLIVAAAVIIIGVTLALRHLPLLERLQALIVDWIAAPRLKQLTAHLFALLRSAAALLRTRILYAGLVLSLVAWGAEGIALYYILIFIGLDFAMPAAVGIYAISVLAGALSFIPGGLGGTEAVMGFLLISAGADPASAVAATLICRIATLWFAVVIGILAMAGLEMRKRLGVRIAE
jgi:uncharacterized protein (TIRG00374 family)